MQRGNVKPVKGRETRSGSVPHLQASTAKGSTKIKCSRPFISSLMPVLCKPHMRYPLTNVRAGGFSAFSFASRGHVIDSRAPPSGRFDAVTLPP
jgi:hypothetical protein